MHSMCESRFKLLTWSDKWLRGDCHWRLFVCVYIKWCLVWLWWTLPLMNLWLGPAAWGHLSVVRSLCADDCIQDDIMIATLSWLHSEQVAVRWQKRNSWCGSVSEGLSPSEQAVWFAACRRQIRKLGREWVHTNHIPQNGSSYHSRI